MACPSFSLSLLFVPFGAALRLLRLVGAECNIHAPADFLKLGNLGAGVFQFGIVAVPLRLEVGIFLFPFCDRQALCPFRQVRMEIAVCRVP